MPKEQKIIIIVVLVFSYLSLSVAFFCWSYLWNFAWSTKGSLIFLGWGVIWGVPTISIWWLPLSGWRGSGGAARDLSALPPSIYTAETPSKGLIPSLWTETGICTKYNNFVFQYFVFGGLDSLRPKYWLFICLFGIRSCFGKKLQRRINLHWKTMTRPFLKPVPTLPLGGPASQCWSGGIYFSA